jgi:hypothetical protein
MSNCFQPAVVIYEPNLFIDHYPNFFSENMPVNLGNRKYM